jgi:hypothetical protein
VTVATGVGVLLIGWQMPVRGGDIIALEFVWTPERAREQLDTWVPRGWR